MSIGYIGVLEKKRNVYNLCLIRFFMKNVVEKIKKIGDERAFEMIKRGLGDFKKIVREFGKL